MLRELSNVLGVNIENILLGELDPNDTDGGNMRRINFYVCHNCGNIINSSSEAQISCCGRKLELQIPTLENVDHEITVNEIENEYYITIQHEMSKTHYISFIAHVTLDRVIIVKLYPEQDAEVRIPKMVRGDFYAYCSQHGLWMKVNK
ncbi:XRE family transcriptional regulator [Litchfieldia salsa]|uniref:Desulfoferrodoxin, superoxide reductase-like (SORL) domain n=1 Tax=Litchfieldia salsa TaxID=930152 RepID=A0A1H0SY46_9BACI|nr:XRE family transcriptional regulator [Litchfieldia salsa]SDP46276.1 Desulfoferrodoxin, superoxide reductase-like (SORL) domain [Litchfieldia salsa]